MTHRRAALLSPAVETGVGTSCDVRLVYNGRALRLTLTPEQALQLSAELAAFADAELRRDPEQCGELAVLMGAASR